MFAKIFTRGTALAFAAALSIASAPAMAQNFPSGGPSYNTVDPVTGYPCVDNQCSVVRVTQSDVKCICKKENPGVQNLADLRLTCQTTQGGQWVACPYSPRYGG